MACSGSSVCEVLWQSWAPSQTHTHTQIYSPHKSQSTHSHAVWAGIVFIALCFHSTEAISIVTNCAHCVCLCVCVSVWRCINVCAYMCWWPWAYGCIYNHSILFPKHPPLCAFPQEYVCVCVYVSMQWKELVMSQTFATKAHSPRSTRVQPAFVKAMCGVLCAALQWLCDREP